MKYHNFLKNKFINWFQLEKEIEKIEGTSSSKEKGDIFEDFVFAYLEINKAYYQIENHWQSKNAPIELKEKLGIEIKDAGVDGLIKFNDGKYGAYQAKFRSGRKKPSYEEISKFWAESRNCDRKYVIANSFDLTKLTSKEPNHYQILGNDFMKLSSDFFEELYSLTNKKVFYKKFFEPDPHQIKMIQETVTKFQTTDRGKLISACGTGKTLTALWIAEEMQANNVLFVAPSIALIKQTLEEWSKQAKAEFDYFCVTCDKSVDDDLDEIALNLNEIDIPVSTNINELIFNLRNSSNKKNKYIFSTYQSLDLLAAASKKVDIKFDLGIFDEAHRTAGTSNSYLFSLGLNDKNILINKRLFMTATERLVLPRIKRIAEFYDREIFSMNDKKIYGENFFTYSFGDAINDKVISDYEILICGITNKEIYDWIDNNNFLKTEGKGTKEFQSGADNVFKQLLLIKAFADLPIKKCISFHNDIRSAKGFINGKTQEDISFGKVLDFFKDIDKDDFYIDHINGSMSAGERAGRLDSFSKKNYGLITNAQCLTEGIDVPIIDSIYFVEPRNSIINIVQACGRALRKKRNSKFEKKAFFIIPILINENSDKDDESFNKINFEMVYNLVQSLRDQDTRIAQWIDQINLDLGSGRTPSGGGNNQPITIKLPVEFNVEQFASKLFLKIAEVNGNYTTNFNLKNLSLTSRKSKEKRIIKTICDYTINSLKDKLILPTLNKFSEENQLLKSSFLRFNNNNVSHSVRLGIINTKDKKYYYLTSLGKKLFKKEITFEDLFKSQILKYFELIELNNTKYPIFPYRLILNTLIKVDRMNFFEYIFSVYLIKVPSLEAYNQAINNIYFLRENYPNITKLNENNRNKVLDKLNTKFNTSYSANDIWNKRTTVYNQWIYMKNHLLIYENFIDYAVEENYLSINHHNKKNISALLDETKLLFEDLEIEDLTQFYENKLIKFKKYTI